MNDVDGGGLADCVLSRQFPEGRPMCQPVQHDGQSLVARNRRSPFCVLSCQQSSELLVKSPKFPLAHAQMINILRVFEIQNTINA